MRRCELPAATEAEVQEFLNVVRPSAARREVLFCGNREKNRRFLLRHRLTLDDACVILEELEVEDYSRGPEPDNKGRSGRIWFFGPDYCSAPIYLKVADKRPEIRRFLCISLHDTPSPLPLPYRKGKKP